MAPRHLRRRNNGNVMDGAPRTRRHFPLLQSDTENGMICPEVFDYASYRTPKNNRDLQKEKSILKSGCTGFGLPDGLTGTIVHTLTSLQKESIYAIGVKYSAAVKTNDTMAADDGYLLGEFMLSVMLNS